MKDLVRWVCDEAKRRGAAFADARAGESTASGVFLQDGRSERLSQSTSRRLGVRVMKEGAWGFATTEDVTRAGAEAALDAALAMARASEKLPCDLADIAPVDPVIDTVAIEPQEDPRSVSAAEKMRSLQAFERAMLERAGDVAVNTIVNYSDTSVAETLANTRGTLLEVRTVRTWLGAGITVQREGLRQRAFERRAAQRGYELVRETTPEELSIRAADVALSLLGAALPPSGKFPVVFSPGVTGLFTHEAIGHNAEADLVLAGTSIIEGKIGEKIGSELVTIIDESDLGTTWGSYQYDSEGTPAQRRVIIENGVLRGLMHSLTTASHFGVPANGSGRAQDCGCRPQVRMSNTYIQPAEGNIQLEDMIRDIDLGLYAKGGHSGYVMCEKGQFTCNVGEGRMIRNGQLAEPVRDVAVNGMTLEALHNIDRVASDFSLDWPGMCGKGGQGMPNNCGGPHIRIKELVVGGQTELR